MIFNDILENKKGLEVGWACKYTKHSLCMYCTCRTSLILISGSHTSDYMYIHCRWLSKDLQYFKMAYTTKSKLVLLGKSNVDLKLGVATIHPPKFDLSNPLVGSWPFCSYHKDYVTLLCVIHWMTTCFCFFTCNPTQFLDEWEL